MTGPQLTVARPGVRVGPTAAKTGQILVAGPRSIGLLYRLHFLNDGLQAALLALLPCIA
jgi:hypothetical protein